MSVFEMTQWLLVQSAESNRRSEITGPRFHDLLRIYQRQNRALAELRNVRSANKADNKASFSMASDMQNLPSPQPQFSQEILRSTSKSIRTSLLKDQGVDDYIRANLPSFLLTRAVANRMDFLLPALPSELPLIITSHSSTPQRHLMPMDFLFTALPSQLPPIITSETSTPQRHRLRNSELGKRPHSTSDMISTTRSLLFMAADGSRRARIC